MMNEISVVDDVAYVYITTRTSKRYTAIIDAEDVPKLLAAGRRWSYTKYVCYSSRFTTPRVTLLHRLILGFPSVFVDHINGDTLDNRKCNLRIATNQGNQHNRVKPMRNSSTGVLGVTYCADTQRHWRGRVRIKGMSPFSIFCDTKEEAIEAVTKYRREHMPFSKEAREEQ